MSQAPSVARVGLAVRSEFPILVTPRESAGRGQLVCVRSRDVGALVAALTRNRALLA